MNDKVFWAVLASAFFQASWNFFAKRSSADKIALLATSWFLFGLLMAPFAFFFFSPEWSNRVVLLLVLSGFVHAIYLVLLGYAYSIAEISVIFPVARGLGVLGTAVLSVFFGMGFQSSSSYLGVFAVVAGALCMGSAARGIGILLGAVISGYSLIDAMGAREVPGFFYLMNMNVLAPLFAAPFLWKKKNTQICDVLKHHKLESLGVAIAGSVAYALILWAYRQSPAPAVVALREFSMLIAAILGVIFLQEKISWRKSIGLVLIFFGVIALRWAQ